MENASIKEDGKMIEVLLQHIQSLLLEKYLSKNHLKLKIHFHISDMKNFNM